MLVSPVGWWGVKQGPRLLPLPHRQLHWGPTFKIKKYHTGSYTGVPPYPVYFDFTLSYGRLTLNKHGGPSRYRIRFDQPSFQERQMDQ